MNQLIKVIGRQGLAYCKTNFLKVELFKHIMSWRIPSTQDPAALGLFLPAYYREILTSVVLKHFLESFLQTKTYEVKMII